MMANSCISLDDSNEDIMGLTNPGLSKHVFLLQIMSRWMKVLSKLGGPMKFIIKSWKSVTRDAKDEENCTYKDNSNGKDSQPLLKLLKVFLKRYELLVYCSANISNPQTQNHTTPSPSRDNIVSNYAAIALDVLEIPIRLFKKIRSRCPKLPSQNLNMGDDEKSTSSNEDESLVWQDVLTTKLLGESQDCVWICEQVS